MNMNPLTSYINFLNNTQCIMIQSVILRFEILSGEKKTLREKESGRKGVGNCHTWLEKLNVQA